ncbi:unnamed protein product [Dracunculus medinensis]|uniref:Beta-lactamase domain-containing protein n=1 Tax=Dracunculus medinensis TaxID=318479 RepID=A0A0N4U3C0_DRAME|nr:unnamed protein product [Dracunculus medinensis]
MRNYSMHIDGDCDSRFNAVKQTFSENFTSRLESEGAAFAVYLNGEKIVDLWGGYADSSSKRKWKDDTVSVLFSTTKSISAICIAVLVDRGLLNYKDLISKHWPEFGQNGKENITIEQLLSHQAGLAYTDCPIEEIDVKDHNRISKIFENQVPNWTPGQKMGYHMLSIGFLSDQLVRRVDPKKRSLSAFFEEEIVIPNGLDLRIGTSPALEHRVARLAHTSKFAAAREILEYPVILKFLWNMFGASQNNFFWNAINRRNSQSQQLLNKITSNFAWLGNDVIFLNNPDIRSLDIPAATGVGTARSLAKLHSLIATGDLLKESTVDQLLKPDICDEFDIVLTFRHSRGKGFMYTKNPKGQWMFGHPGMGGQNVKVDIKNKVAFAYICNGLKCGAEDYTMTFMRLQKALYQCLDNNNLLNDDVSINEIPIEGKNNKKIDHLEMEQNRTVEIAEN